MKFNGFNINTKRIEDQEVRRALEEIERQSNSIKEDIKKLASPTPYVSPKQITVESLESTVPSGKAPFNVKSSTLVKRLNADLLDGLEASDFLQSVETDGTTIDGDGTVADPVNYIGALADQSDVNITSVADEDILQYDSGTSKWVNTQPPEGFSVTILGSEETLIDSGNVSTDANYQFKLNTYDATTEDDTSALGVRMWKVKITATSSRAYGTVTIKCYFASGVTAPTTSTGSLIIDHSNSTTSTLSTTRTLLLPHGTHNVYVDGNINGPGNEWSINIVGKEIQLNSIIY